MMTLPKFDDEDESSSENMQVRGTEFSEHADLEAIEIDSSKEKQLASRHIEKGGESWVSLLLKRQEQYPLILPQLPWVKCEKGKHGFVPGIRYFWQPKRIELYWGRIFLYRRKAAAYISLVEAAKLAKITEDQLLEYGGSGEIRLVVKVPDEKACLPVDSNTDTTGVPMYGCVPDMLILERLHCNQISRYHQTEQSDFRRGYMFSFGKLKLIPATWGNTSSSNEEHVWRVFNNQGKRDYLAITRENIFISSEDIQHFIRVNPCQSIGTVDLEKVKYISEKLILLNMVAKDVWERIYDEEEGYPTHKAVVKLLKEDQVVKLSQVQADRAARIIRPRYAHGKPNKNKQVTRKSYRTEQFEALLEASKFHFEGINLEKRNAFPKPGTIAKWLEEERGFKSYLAETAATLVIPEKEFC